MLLLPQLVKIWLPDYSETDRSPLSEQAPRLGVPPLISFLEGLSDVLTTNEVRGKRFPCGHVVSVRSILSCCNFFGDAIWTPGPHFLGCAWPGCDDTLEFPKIPDPRVLDGLQTRLDLIQWSWNKDTPTEVDMNTVSLLRDILSRIGHLSQDPEPEMDANLSRSDPSEPSLTRTLVHMELEAYGLMIQNREKSTDIDLRGSQDYCRYRAAVVPTAGHSLLRYPMSSPGQSCVCVKPHEYEREASSWARTPAETGSDLNEPRDRKLKQRKTVRFVAPIVTEVQYFEPWWCDEYRDSGRYWSTGPHRKSIDYSTPGDDDWEVERLEHPDGLAAQISSELEHEESACGTSVDDDGVLDDGILDEMERANESWDDETLDGLERANESWEDDTLGDLEKLHESWEDRF